MSRTIWLVEHGEYEQTYIAAAFETEELANEYVEKRSDGYVSEVELHDSAVGQVPLWARIAEVYPDGTVEEASRTEQWDAPGPPALSDSGRVFGGHAQSHCGFHVYVSGGDRNLVEETFQRRVQEALAKVDGTCSECGRTGPRWYKGMGSTEPVKVALVGGPKNGEVHDEQMPMMSCPDSDDWAFGWGGVLCCFSLTLEDGKDTSASYNYGSVKKDGDRWVRHFLS